MLLQPSTFHTVCVLFHANKEVSTKFKLQNEGITIVAYKFCYLESLFI